MATQPAKPAAKPAAPGPKPAASVATPPPAPAPNKPIADIDIEGSGIGPDKGGRRLFQSGDDPSRKEWLTKAEAEKRGHYWATEEEIKQRQGGIKGST